MRPSGNPDTFVIINGPEDGTEFPILRAPFYIGRDPVCTVHVRLDRRVEERHARVTAVSDGYRLRAVGDAHVYVNGKRAGLVRSRIAQSGDTLQVGNTLMVLECALDGLGSRSHGLPTESDLGWALRNAFRFSWRGGYKLLRLLKKVFHLALHAWKMSGLLLAVIVLLYVFAPGFRHQINGIAFALYDRLLGFLWTVRSSLR